MNIKKKIQNSWLNPELPDVCLKKDQLDFSKRKRISISVRAYVLSISCLILVFSLTFFLVKFDFKKNDDNPQTEKIEFGSLDPLQLNIAAKELSKININNRSYYNVRGNFSLWFNSLNAKKAKVDYSKIELNDYIKDIKPVTICVANEEYLLFFTQADYLIVLYNDIYIMYDLENANILLDNFVSSF